MIRSLPLGTFVLCIGISANGGTDGDLKEMAAGEQWASLVSGLGVSPHPSAEERFLLAHALLATDRGNESLDVFAAEFSPGDLHTWDTWTAKLIAEKPGTPISHYLRGDALARLGRCSDSLSEFDIAVQLSPRHPLLLHVRAVAKASCGKLDEATDDLLEATMLRPSLATAQESLAAVWIHRKSNAPGAEKAVAAALAGAPNSRIAHYFRWCLRTLVGKFDEADIDREAALSGSPPKMMSAAFAAVAEQIDIAADRVARRVLASGQDPGSVIQQRLEQFRQQGTTRQLVELQQIALAHPQYNQQITRGLLDIGARNPERMGVIASYANNRQALDTHLAKAASYSTQPPITRENPLRLALRTGTLFDAAYAGRFYMERLGNRTTVTQGAGGRLEAPGAFATAVSGGYLLDRDYAGKYYANLADSLWKKADPISRTLAVGTDMLGGLITDQSYSRTQAVVKLVKGFIPGVSTASSGASAIADASQGKMDKVVQDLAGRAIGAMAQPVAKFRDARLTDSSGQFRFTFDIAARELREARAYSALGTTIKAYGYKDLPQKVADVVKSYSTPVLDRQSATRPSRSDFINGLSNGVKQAMPQVHMPATPPGGFATGSPEPLWPDDEWPFRTVYVLCYPIAPLQAQ